MAEILKQRNILIFHGTGGNPLENWFPWLKTELENEGQKVYVPQFPHPQEHPLPDWLEILKDYQQYINEESVLIGHSLGGLFLLRVLEQLKKPVGVKPIRFYDSDFKFSGFDFNWSEIKSKAYHFGVYHSNNDPYVSLGNGEELARRLGVDLTFLPNAGYLNAEAGYTKFDLLLQDIDKIFTA